MSDQPLKRTPAQNAGDARVLGVATVTRWADVPRCQTCARMTLDPVAACDECSHPGETDWARNRRQHENTFGDPPPLA